MEENKPRKKGKPKKESDLWELAELFSKEFSNLNKKLDKLMADFTALNQAIADNSTKIDTIIAKLGTAGGADQASIDTATANIAANNAKLDAANAQ
jgi:predicted  nucleic acid-binding Zn-ribbon protein